MSFNLIPLPAQINPQPGQFRFTPQTRIFADEDNLGNARFLRDLLAPPTGFGLEISPSQKGGPDSVFLLIDPSLADLNPEGYRLNVTPEMITISASTPAGVFYGVQTLRQLLPAAIERREFIPDGVWIVPGIRITDKPRFLWRGYMLDEGRHFHGKETVLRTLDLMALQKLNILHWHLTEDQGWRVEIKRYPNLTEIGSQRAGTARSFSDILRDRHDGLPHGGYYTQDEIREIVAYAAARQITIIPEIELPGHSLAALAANPELSCTGGPFEVATRFGIHSDIYCAGKEATFEFLQNVLAEVLELFPAPYIHIGGDEAPKARWKDCPDCQRCIREEGLADEHALQTYLVNRIGAFIESRGRHWMGWNEILQPGLAKDALVQYWVRNKNGLAQAVRNGQQMVNSAYLDTYLDHSYSLTPLGRAYRFEPVFPELAGEPAGRVLGLEAPMWTEWVPNRARLDYQTYPRLTAFAETGWTPKPRKDYADFRTRLSSFLVRLDILGVHYAPESDWEPPWYKRIFGAFTIAQPQWKVAP
jgi:hexosaminidase